MKLFLTNMIHERYKIIVKTEFENLGLDFELVNYCEVNTTEDITIKQLANLRSKLKKIGVDLLVDKKSILVEKIKIIIIELVHFKNGQIKVNLSDYLSENLNYSYIYLSTLFVEQQGTNIEHFYLSHKIERVKELLIYDELSIKEISDKLFYSSIAHLSNQFKKMTGMTPSEYRHLKHKC